MILRPYCSRILCHADNLVRVRQSLESIGIRFAVGLGLCSWPAARRGHVYLADDRGKVIKEIRIKP